MRIVGISTAHDSSVASYCDGEIEFFMKEERITKRKRDKNPFAAMVETAKFLGNKKIDAVAISAPHNTDVDSYLFAIIDAATKIFKTNNIYKLFNSHHLCHASLAFYNSGFDNAVVVIVDRNGSNNPNSNMLLFESETVFTAEYPSSFKEIKKNYWLAQRGQSSDAFLLELVPREKTKRPGCEISYESLYGITKVYETATILIGEGILENGKTMGLAAYGNENQDFPNLFLDNGCPNDSLFSYAMSSRDNTLAAIYKEYAGKMTKTVDKNDYQFYADYAYQVQKQTQEQVAKLIETAVQRTGIKNVCVSGGYGLNVVANGYYISKFPDVNFFFEPLADDTGNSIGAAMLVYRELSKDKTIRPLKSTFFNGHEPHISAEEFDRHPISYGKATVNDVARLLADNAKLAMFAGKAEGGPRALGNRSILFYPNLADSKDIVNRIKKREWYRPFAACVLKEDAWEYFDMMSLTESPYMTVSFDCRAMTKELFPGIVHVDNSCRVQTVGEENKNLHSLLTAVKELTGHGLLLNTSFNLAGSPLVETIDDAIKVMMESELEYIWIPEHQTLLGKQR